MKFDNPDKDDYEHSGQPLIYWEKEDLEEMLSYKLSNYIEDYSDFLYLYDGKNKDMNLEARFKNNKIDLKKIKNVLRYNSKIIYFSEEPTSNGLWYYPSFFNHSCIPNYYHFGFGDILIIIALNDIEPNTELFLNYFYNDMLYDQRQKYIKNYYNFECNCELCIYEKNKFKENNEKKILEEYLKQLNDNVLQSIPNNERKMKYDKILDKKEIEKMVKFIEKNKKII